MDNNSEIFRLKAQNAQLRARIQELENQLGDMTDATGRLEEEGNRSKDLEKELKATQIEMTDLKKNLEMAKQNNADLKKHLSSANQAYEELRREAAFFFPTASARQQVYKLRELPFAFRNILVKQGMDMENFTSIVGHVGDTEFLRRVWDDVKTKTCEAPMQ